MLVLGPGSVVHVQIEAAEPSVRLLVEVVCLIEEKNLVVALVPHAGRVAWTERAFVQWFVLLALRK